MRPPLSRTLFVLLVTCTCTLAYTYDQPSTPEECNRICQDNEPPKLCYYHFVVEWYTSQGVACQLNSTLSECVIADGVETGLMVINRQLPGPSINVCKNDRVVIDVDNRAEGAEVTIHWHGLFQNNYQYYDGVPGVTQCAIPSSTTFRYSFVVKNSGTHLYHSHVSLQVIQGVYGSLVVRSIPTDNIHLNLYDEDDHVILISDIMHDSVLPGRFPGFLYNNTGQGPSNVLINGLGIFKDPQTNYIMNRNNISTFVVEPGTRYRFRIIDIMSTVCLAELSIEGHRLLLIAQDGEDIEPVYVDRIVLGSGERADVVLHANQEPQNYSIMVRAITECTPDGIYQLAVLHYAGSTGAASSMPDYNTQLTTGVTYNSEDVSNCYQSDEKVCVSELKSADAYDPAILQPGVDARFVFVFGFAIAQDNSKVFRRNSYHRYFLPPTQQVYSSTINNVSYMAPAAPPLSQPNLFSEPPVNHCDEYCEGFNYMHVNRDAIVEFLLFDQYNFTGILVHPFHLHGHAFHVFDEGLLKTSPPTKGEIRRIIRNHQWRLSNGVYGQDYPSKKDTIKVPAGGYAILRFRADNPGWWLFHCHFLWHTVTGMDAVIQVGTRGDLPPIPDNFPTCGNFLPAPVFYD